MHTGDAAIGGAGLAGQIFAVKVLPCVLLQRDGGIASPLGAIVHKPIFADVKIAATGPAMPVVGQAQRQALVKEIVISKGHEGRLLLLPHLLVNRALLIL